MKWLELIVSIIGALGVVVIAVNLWLTRRQNRFVRTFEIYTRLDSPEARQARRYTRHEWNGELAVLDESKRELVHRHINDMDVVGSLILERLTNYPLVVRVFGGMIVSSWDKCRDYIEQRREEYFPYFAIHFQAAVKRIKATVSASSRISAVNTNSGSNLTGLTYQSPRISVRTGQ